MGSGGKSSASIAIALHLLSFSTLASAYFLIARNLYGFNLITHPVQTLRLLTIVEAPVVIGSYSLVRRHPQQCSFWKAAGRGLLGLPVGAFLNAFGAIVLGAPVGIRMDWQHLLAHSKPIENVEYMISLPAHGAIVGAWLGAWPMPLDWERPWQEWPVCVTYGAVAGYLVGLVASSVCILLHGRTIHAKGD